MKTFLIAIELLAGLFLIVAVLLHSAKGEGLGGIGGQARLFSSQKDLEKGLNYFTASVAGIFIVLAVILGLLY